MDEADVLSHAGRVAGVAQEASQDRRRADRRFLPEGQRQAEPVFDPPFAKKFKANKKAWEFFCALPPYYRKSEIRWVHGAKQDATRLRRLDKLIAVCEDGRRR